MKTSVRTEKEKKKTLGRSQSDLLPKIKTVICCYDVPLIKLNTKCKY